MLSRLSESFEVGSFIVTKEVAVLPSYTKSEEYHGSVAASNKKSAEVLLCNCWIKLIIPC